MTWQRRVRTVLNHVKFYQSVYHIASINNFIKSFGLLFISLLVQFFITMDIKNFLLRKRRELSSNSTDGDEQKRPRKASSFNHLIAKGANNGEVFDEALKSGDCVAILCKCMKNLDEKVNEFISYHF